MHDGPDVRLSIRDRLVLKHLETEMRRYRRRNQATGATVPAERAPRRAPWLPLAVALFTTASSFLAVIGILTTDRAVILAFAALWPLTLLQVSRLLRRWPRPRTGR